MRKYIFLSVLIAFLLLVTGIMPLNPAQMIVPEPEPPKLTAGSNIAPVTGTTEEVDWNKLLMVFVQDTLGTVAGSGILGFVLLKLAPTLLEITRGIAASAAKANDDLINLLETFVSDLKKTTEATQHIAEVNQKVLEAVMLQLEQVNRRLDEWDKKEKKNI